MAILSAFVGTPGGIIAKSIAAALAGAFAIAISTFFIITARGDSLDPKCTTQCKRKRK